MDTAVIRIEVNPTLSKALADALDAKGKLLLRFAPALEDALDGTADLRVSSAALDRLLGKLEARSR